MVTMVDESLFVDTNVLVYASVAEAPFHEQAMGALRAAHRARRPLWISRQVLREFVVARTRTQNFARPLTSEIVLDRVRYLMERFHVADDTAAVTGQLIGLLGDFKIGGKQVHDANIVATMRAYGIPCLLTHNIKDFERFGGVIRLEGIVS